MAPRLASLVALLAMSGCSHRNTPPHVVDAGLDAPLVRCTTNAFAFATSTLVDNTASMASAHAVHAIDLDRDGKVDLVAIACDPSGSPCQPLVLLGDGHGAFRALPPGATLDTPRSVPPVFDLDGDGNLDLMVPTGGAYAALLGNGDGTFRVGPSLPGPALAAGDFNRDGIIDLVGYDGGGVGAGGSIHVWLGQHGGTFGAPITSAMPTNDPYNVLAFDANGDGWLDVAVMMRDGPSVILVGDGTGKLSSFASIQGGTFTRRGMLADVARDGALDLFACGENVRPCTLALARGGYTTAPIDVGAVETVADFDGDGNVDLVAIDGIYAGHGDGTFAAAIAGPSVSNGLVPLDGALPLDADGDGKLDLAFLDQTGSLLLALNQCR